MRLMVVEAAALRKRSRDIDSTSCDGKNVFSLAATMQLLYDERGPSSKTFIAVSGGYLGS
jgi:hypothetical protein